MTSPAPHPFKDFVEHVDILTPLTIHRAPDSVGLYAWYGQIAFGPKDWEQQILSGVDEGEKTCRSLLQRHTTRYSSPKINIEGRGTFSTTWRGTLDDVTIERLRATISGDTDHSENNSKGSAEELKRLERFQHVLRRSDLRGTLLKVLKVCTPFVSAPIYVGVATSLRDRLKTHTDQFFKLSQAVAKNPERKRELLESDNSNFASRALAMGFNEDNVIAWTMNLSSMFHAVGRDDLRSVAESAEWLLNRWHKPLLGKR